MTEFYQPALHTNGENPLGIERKEGRLGQERIF